MSIDAGGLAQMTYNNNFQPNGGIGMPTAGFASRGKGAALKRLSLASPPKVASIAENGEVATPRTSRSHLLAGLRTAPKTPTVANPPASAPYHQRQHNIGGDATRYTQAYRGPQGVPQTATGASFPINQYQSQMAYEQVLAPPTVRFDDGEIDPNVAAQLLATELYLAQRQQQLQQQLLNLSTQQLGGLQLNGYRPQQPLPHTPFTPQMNSFQQQMQVPQETGQPGVYLVYNQLTGQPQYVVDPSFQQGVAMTNTLPPPTPSYSHSPPKTSTPTVQVSPPNEINPSPWGSRSSSPPKKSTTPPQNFTPLPPPSANAFRRGHKKQPSSLALDSTASVLDGPKSAFVRPVGLPATPMTGTFGPGQARAGEHPIRQPRGPPSIEELRAAPTSKMEGSKNFAARQRRQAVNNLVRAGIGRRGQRSGSPGSMSPVSETELSHASDNDSDVGGARKLSATSSAASLRTLGSGVIGSERQASRERISRTLTANSVSSEEGASIGGGLIEIRTQKPRLVLTGAEKRQNTMF